MKLLIATTNPAKLAEFKRLLKDLPLELVSLSDVSIAADVEETGNSFEENAILKAKFYHDLSGLPTIADDGGVEIDILNGEPGVHSRRWAGPENNIVHDQASDDRLIEFTLGKLQGLSLKDRGAQMRAIVAYVNQNGDVYTGEGIVRGIIAEHADTRRNTGFPFRSLFFLPEINKFYNHDVLTPEENERFNHRRKALDKLKEQIIMELR